MFDKNSLKGLTVAAIGVSALLVASVANAAIGFRPGSSVSGIAAGAGCTAALSNDFSGLIGSQAPGNMCPIGSGGAITPIDLMVWDTGDLATNDSTWLINVSDNATGAFEENFFMGLRHTVLGAAETGWGLNRFNTYVTMEMDLEGFINTPDETGLNALTNGETVQLVGNYSTASTMTMRFHADGNPDPLLADGVIIAEFALTGGGSIGPAIDDPDTELVFRATYTSGVVGTLTNGGVDFASLISPILTVTTNDFRDAQVSDITGAGTSFLVGTGGQAITEFRISEPGAMAIFGLGLLGLGVAARRRRNAAA